MFLSISVFSQNQPLQSTSKKDYLSTEISEDELFKVAKDFIAKKEYSKAASILSKNYHRFSESLNINWLYAHVFLLVDKKIQADHKFKKAISLAPNNKELQMDYARFLYQTGEIDKVEAVLANFMDENSKNVEFLLMQANISFWNGDTKSAQKKVDQIQEIYPGTDITKNLENQIKQLTAFYVRANFEYQTDSQPMDYFAQHISIEKYISKFLNPRLEVSNYNFSPQTEQALILKLGNKMRFDQLNLTLDVTGGAYKNFSGETDWIGGVRFEQKLADNASLNFGYSKNSVLGTIASTEFNLTKQDVFGELDYNNKWLVFHTAYNQQFYQDDNTITLFGGYIVSQPVKVQKFGFQLGYGYNYSDAENILFVFDDQGMGVYDPYFTPKEQQIHSGLFIVSYKPFQKLTLQGKLNYGIEATVSNPYPLEVAPNVFEIGGFYDETFDYTEIEGSINYVFSSRFSINAAYIFQETFFYKRDNINLGLNYTF